MIIKVQLKKILIINTYFPVDPRTVGGENIELENVLAEISNLINSTNFDSLHLVGDLNCDFLRNSSHVEAIKNFITRLDFYSVWRDYPIDFTHTFQKEDGNCYINTLDHILTLNRSDTNVVDAGVIHHVDNMSDHEPIYVLVKVEGTRSVCPNEPPPDQPISKPKWKEASAD